MSNINRIIRSGRLGSDPDVKYFENGSAVTSFSFASNQYDPKAKKEKPLWFKVNVWGKQGEFINEYAKKGAYAVVDGELDVEEWEKDGQKNYKLVIKASNVDLVKSDSASNTANTETKASTSSDAVGEDEIPF